MLEARRIPTQAEVAQRGGLRQPLDLRIDRAQVALHRVQRLGDHRLFAGQALHVLGQVADRIAPHDLDRLQLHLYVGIHQCIGVAHHLPVAAGERAGVHAEADLAGFVTLRHVCLRRQNLLQGSGHVHHRRAQPADLIAAAHLHVMLQVTARHCTRCAFHRHHRGNHGTSQPPPQQHHQHHRCGNGQHRTDDQHAARLFRAGFDRRFGYERGARAQGIQRGAQRPVLAAHQGVAFLRVVTAGRERLQGTVVVLLQRGVLADEGLRQLHGLGVIAFGQSLRQRTRLFALRIEGTQVLGSQRLIAAAQQHVLPFLHLHAELALQRFGLRVARDFRRNRGRKIQPRRAQTGHGAQHHYRQANGKGTQQLELQAEGARRRGRGGFGHVGTAKREGAIRYRTAPVPSEVRRGSHFLSHSLA